MKTIAKVAVISFFLLLGFAALSPMSDAVAQSEAIRQGVRDVGGGEAEPLTGVVDTLIDVFLFIIGALSVIMIIYGGFRYVTSAGEASAVSAAKNTILYAVIGLVIAISAYAIADFVIDIFEKETTNSVERDNSIEKDRNLENNNSVEKEWEG